MSKHLTRMTTDHDTIRKWAEERGGHPAAVKSTRKEGAEIGIIRIDFPGYSGGQSLEEIPWDEFFEKFDDSDLVFMYEDETSEGEKSHFNRLVTRETAEARSS